MVHRDLKPANVKVREDDTVKVLDFGLAKALDPEPAPEADMSQSPTLTVSATRMGVVMGTPSYMSPEQAAGTAVGIGTDLWSFGVVLYEMLAGERLFGGETVPHVLARVLDRELDLSNLPPATPAPVRRVLRRCLERDPRRRMRDAGEAISDLEAALKPEAAASTAGAPRAPHPPRPGGGSGPGGPPRAWPSASPWRGWRSGAPRRRPRPMSGASPSTCRRRWRAAPASRCRRTARRWPTSAATAGAGA